MTLQPLRSRRFWIPLLVQLALIAAVPAQAVYTHLTGRTVVLQTAPIDPYDLLRGYSQTLGYDISTVNTLKKLPGGAIAQETPILYVILQRPAAQTSGRPAAWKPIRVSRDRPDALPDNQVALKGKVQYGQVDYGLSTYYLPETRRDEVNTAIVESQRKQSSVVEIKVDAQGNAVPLRLWVSDRAYEF
ncbi:GDYXXLXY domain-containing protein [Myxacorys almedinensis]|uniref:Membrane-anchored protein n=1 Tax=Myxacorys almedinensis A TaxID=2690445 RepID=A0A8J7Z1T0_9CYAN|nr:GDYXXLXY domain-containing protein [Myxacorys almedinensis]NDJ18487.1 membrane-anchored protein [Myxacorys almedinensis A]